ncbi:sulfatase-like hydrolase/transferase [bacterium]|nr:sulfatase-like hydrolase/transferase [bacterium]
MQSTRTRGVLTLLVGLLMVSSVSAAKQSNIVFFLVDDMGWQETSVPFHSEITELNRRYHTPNMERLAAQGMKFTQAYASAVCSPTRVSALTGMNAARHRVTNWTLRKNASPDNPHKTLQPPVWNVNGISSEEGVERTMQVTTLPSLLQKGGYRTIHVGKAHLGAKETPGENPLNLGFDVNIAGHAAGGPGSYWGEKNFSAAWRTNPPAVIWDVPGLEDYHGKDVFLTEALTLEAIKAVEKSVIDEQPFYLYMSHYAVHAPWEKDERYYQKYVDAGLKPFEATLASMIEGMDQSLGDLMAALDRLGVADDTIVIFMSDNGSPSQCPRNLPLRGHKLTPYEGGIREPMIVKWPGVTLPSTTNTNPIIIEDFFPSILELAGVDWQGKTHQVVDGLSFVPLLKGEENAPEDRAFVWHFPHNYSGQGPYSAIRQGVWKLIHHHAGHRLELFNIEEDIGEKNNLAEKRPAKVSELARQLGRKLRSQKAQMPLLKSTGKPIDFADEAIRISLRQTSSPTLKVSESAIARNLVWKGVAIDDPNHTIWGASPIEVDGKFHLFAARWPETKVDPAWRKSSEIAHYIAEKAEGTFKFLRVVVKGSGRIGDWDAFAPHNPEIQRFGNIFALCYIANTDYHQPPHPLNQQIGMMVSSNINGPWKKVGHNGLILDSSPDPDHFSHGNQVVNPALLKVGDKFHLYYKTRGKSGTLYALAIADQLTGPYQMLNEPLTTEGVFIEDGSAFMWNEKVCLLTTDNHGKVTGIVGGGALWVSEDGIHFNRNWTQLGYDLIPRYFPNYESKHIKKIYGGDPKFERPKVLCMDHQPSWLYAPSGWNVTGGQRTVCHVLKIELASGDGPLSGIGSLDSATPQIP